MPSRRIQLLAVVALTLAIPAALGQEPAESPQQLIKDVVYNELVDHWHHSFFEYVDTKRIGQQTIVKAEVETGEGGSPRFRAGDANPPTQEQEKEKPRRLEALPHDSSQQQKLLRD